MCFREWWRVLRSSRAIDEIVATDLAHELCGRGLDVMLGGRWINIK